MGGRRTPGLWWVDGDGTIGNPIPGAYGWANWAGIPSVSRATELITDILAGLPWRVVRGREVLSTPDWLADPQGLRRDGRVLDPGGPEFSRWSWMDFWTEWLVSAVWYGDGFVYVPNRDAGGAPKPPMWILHPDDVRLENGQYSVRDVELEQSQIIHLRGKAPIVGGRGTGVFQKFGGEFAYARSMRSYAAGVFQSGVPAGYLKVIAPGLAQPKADKLKERWLAAHGGNTRSIAVLDSVTEFHPLTFSPVDSALVDVMRENLNDVANAFGIPAYLIGGSTDSNTYANIESRRLDLATFTYLPWTARIEAVLDAQLPRGTSVKMALDALARADTKTRYEVYKIGKEIGALTSR